MKSLDDQEAQCKYQRKENHWNKREGGKLSSGLILIYVPRRKHFLSMTVSLIFPLTPRHSEAPWRLRSSGTGLAQLAALGPGSWVLQGPRDEQCPLDLHSTSATYYLCNCEQVT